MQKDDETGGLFGKVDESNKEIYQDGRKVLRGFDKSYFIIKAKGEVSAPPIG